ncbi:MAG: hypothetical protein M1835_001330 [Candelina submexicana]|nr:MAG: hypothetical protein M1835_001330 [Candelina submexicana]
MTDFRAFHDKVKEVRPNQPAKPSTYWVAVLHHTKKPALAVREDDFLWVKCHHKITVQTIKAQYHNRDPLVGPIILKLGNDTVNDTDQMSTLNRFGDNIIVFHALQPDAAQGPPEFVTRQPLQPVNTQITTRMESPVAPLPKQEYRPEEYKSPHSPAPLSGQLKQTFGTLRSTPGSDSSAFSNGVPGKRMPSTHLPSNGPSPLTTPFHSQGFLGSSFNPYPHSKSPISDKPLTGSRTDSPARTPGLADTQRSWAQSRGMTEPLSEGEEKDSIEYSREAQEQDDDAETEHHDENSTSRKNSKINEVLSKSSPEVLEAGVQRGVQILEKLKGPLVDKSIQSQDAAQWLQQVGNLQKQAVKTKTIVGVVGNTGAGKSSVINAMLDEERLVPTNCMRACTAVVTEMSYNDSEDPQARYRAEIEFITAADWEKELKIIFEELIDGSGGISRECTNQDSEAGIAYAKIRAVYPGKTQDELANSSVQRLMQENAVRNLLGTSKEFEMGDAMMFYKRLQYFVDSKEKTTGDKEKNKKNKEKREMEYWPLIRVVKLYIKAPALSTGAVIVDLPGVHDSNAARAAVAESYMKQCTGLWIVAPINRAVDDKAAKSLLGESFKRQLKMDGGYSSVTFICSKTDDISLTEATDSLGLEDENNHLWEQLDSYDKDLKRLKNELEDLHETKTVYKQTMDDVEEQLDTWEALKEAFEEGKTIYRPSSKLNGSNKRKRGSSEDSKQRKKQRRSGSGDSGDDDNDDDFIDDGPLSDMEREMDEPSEIKGDPLTVDQIDIKISELKTTKKEARRERSALDENIANVRQRNKRITEEKKEIEGTLSAKCIKGRNDYSKGAIQTDFAAGIKELDQELAMEDDEENFNPDVDVRDYDEVARSLPVFCVSSRAYQKLQGRLKKEAAVPGFKDVEGTEIPALQAHCRKLTEAGRANSCRRFLNQLSQLLNSMSLWASDDGTGPSLSEDQQAKETQRLSGRLKKLEKGLEKCVASTIKELKGELNDNIYDNYDPGISSAEDDAPETVASWGAKVNRDNRHVGGYYWSTYKAICRRNGVYSNGQGPHDFNLQLAEPLVKQLAGGWEKCFARRLPNVLTAYTKSSASLLKDFHRDADDRARQNGVGVTGLHVLKQQLQVYESIFKDMGTEMVETINAQQREINREFTPVIAAAMLTAYETCTAEGGPGSYMRMKYAMQTHVDEARTTMFRQSTNEVRARLNAMIRDVEENMANKADEVFLKMRRDYLAVLGGRALPKGEVMPKWERSMKHQIQQVIEGSEAIFEEVLDERVKSEDSNAEEGKVANCTDHTPKLEISTPNEDLHMDDQASAKEDKQQTHDERGAQGTDTRSNCDRVTDGPVDQVTEEKAGESASPTISKGESHASSSSTELTEPRSSDLSELVVSDTSNESPENCLNSEKERTRVGGSEPVDGASDGGNPSKEDINSSLGHNATKQWSYEDGNFKVTSSGDEKEMI